MLLDIGPLIPPLLGQLHVNADVVVGGAAASVERSDDLSAEVILAQVRSIIADLLAVCGMDPLEATDVIPMR